MKGCCLCGTEPDAGPAVQQTLQKVNCLTAEPLELFGMPINMPVCKLLSRGINLQALQELKHKVI